MSAADELAQALRQLAVGEADFHLADLLIETAQRVEVHGQAQLRERVQGVLGESHVTIQDRLDSLLNIGRDTHQLVMNVQAEQVTQGAAVGALRAEFQTIGETVSGISADVDDLRARQLATEAAVAHIADSLSARPSVEETQRLIARSDADHDLIQALQARLDARPSPEKAQATYDGVQRILAHLGLTPDDQEETV